MAYQSDVGPASGKLGKDQIIARTCFVIALILGPLAVGMAFIPPRYDYNAGQNSSFCPVPALYDRPGLVNSLTTNKDPNNSFGDVVASRLADECGEKIDHHLRIGIGATTLTAPLSFVALCLYVRRRLQPLPENFPPSD
jgi:hypothetical protein